MVSPVLKCSGCQKLFTSEAVNGEIALQCRECRVLGPRNRSLWLYVERIDEERDRD